MSNCIRKKQIFYYRFVSRFCVTQIECEIRISHRKIHLTKLHVTSPSEPPNRAYVFDSMSIK